MYANGTGVTKDEVRAVALYKQACDGGSLNGCANLGVMYGNERVCLLCRARHNRHYAESPVMPSCRLSHAGIARISGSLTTTDSKSCQSGGKSAT